MPGGGFAYQQHVYLVLKVETGIGVVSGFFCGSKGVGSAKCALGNFFGQ